MITIKLNTINTGAANFSSFCNALDPDPAIYTFIAQNNKNEINKQFYFILEFEEKTFKKGDVILLKNGYTAIIEKYYSNDKIGVIFDEYADDVEEYIKKEDIDKIIKSKK